MNNEETKQADKSPSSREHMSHLNSMVWGLDRGKSQALLLGNKHIFNKVT